MRRLFKSFAEHGESGMDTHYDGCGAQQRRRTSQEVLDDAMQMRTDHPPWGSTRNEFPTDLALWLFGLEIDVIWNPPCQPRKNGVVERSQGVGKSWSEPETCLSPPELQQRIDKMDRRWVIQDESGSELRNHPADQLTQEQIIGLKVYHRRPKAK